MFNTEVAKEDNRDNAFEEIMDIKSKNPHSQETQHIPKRLIKSRYVTVK